MTLPQLPLGQDRRTNGTAWFDVFVVAMILIWGLVFLWNPRGWAPNVYIGNDQFGDAEFWWDGALQFAQAIIWNNINIAYRMGYAIFAGLLVALFGPDYAVFHKLLLLLFLGIASGGYLILAARIGRIAALAMTAALVFSPFQAEWLAISTSDSLGLIWNLIALFSLFVALSDGLRLRWLAAAGIFLAFGGLTRPLMTLFIAPAVLFVLLQFRSSLRVRGAGIAVLIAAFALPTLVWTLAFYIHTGSLVSASNDGSIFYAASNPKIQVWDSSIYGPVEEAAKARLGLPSATDVQMNQEFRYQAFMNYRTEWAYHLRRLPQHVLALARFSYHNTNAADRLDTILRWLVRGLLTIAVVASCLLNRRVLDALLAAGICALSLWPGTAGWVVVASATLCLLPGRDAAVSQVHRLVSAYWWAGVVALYFAGGTWGPPLRAQFDIHALGYRLGLQFLFANEWLVVLAIVAIAGVPSIARDLSLLRPLRPWLASAAVAAATLRFARSVGIVLLAGILMTGATIIGVRGWQVSHAVPVPMPSTASVVSALCASDGNRQPLAQMTKAEPAVILQRMWAESFEPERRLEGAHLFTGMLGGLIWQIASQERTRAILHQQDQYFPFVFSAARTHVEFDDLIHEPAWRYRQGAWIVRSFREAGPVQGSVFFESLPKVQVFVPLSADGQSFDTAHMVRFPLARYASALAYADRLKARDAQIEWQQYPTSDVKRRWFLLMPPENAKDLRTAGVEIDASDALGQSKLSLAFRVEPLPGVPVGKNPITISVESIDATGARHTLLERSSPARGIFVNVPTDNVAVDVPADAVRLNVIFSGLGAKDYVRVVELQLTSSDIAPGLANEFCAPG